MTESSTATCPYPWCVAEPVDGADDSVARNHLGPASAVIIGDDTLTMRAVATPAFDPKPDEEQLVEIESTILSRPGVYDISYLRLTRQECDEVIGALIRVRQSIGGPISTLVRLVTTPMDQD